MDPKSLPLTDKQLATEHPAVAELVKTLDDVAARDPSPGVVAIAAGLAAYFRTPD